MLSPYTQHTFQLLPRLCLFLSLHFLERWNNPWSLLWPAANIMERSFSVGKFSDWLTFNFWLTDNCELQKCPKINVEIFFLPVFSAKIPKGRNHGENFFKMWKIMWKLIGIQPPSCKLLSNLSSAGANSLTCQCWFFLCFIWLL